MNFSTATTHLVAALGLALAAAGALAAPPAYQLRVDGLACPFCTYGLEKKLGAVPGVQGVATRIEDGTVTVTMKDGATLEEGAAKRAVSEAGFSLRGFKQVPSAGQAK